MKKNILYWIKKLKGVLRKASNKNLDSEVNKHKNQVPDFIQLLDNAVNDINAYTNDMVQTTHLQPDQYELHVYIHDNLQYTTFVNQDFKEKLSEKIMMENNYSFARYILHEGTCKSASICNNGVGIRLQAKQTDTYATRAIIEAVEGHGSLIGGSIEITAEYCQTNRGYNIGIGCCPKLDNGQIRKNEIAIDDNPLSADFEQNKYVSRSHAHITYDGNNFKLYVERGGTPAAGKTTIVVRNLREILLNYAGTGILLRDGDQIILNKRVILLFREKTQFNN